jgi:hypothetical protein
MTQQKISSPILLSTQVDCTAPHTVYPLIPGVGAITNDQCGSVRGAHRCSNPECGHVELKHYQCHNYECPVCYPSAAHQAGLRIEDRLQGVTSELRRYGVNTGRPVHVILSPPPGEFRPTDDMPTIRKNQVYRYCQDIGMIGGVVVFHPYRIIPELKAELRQYNEKDNPDTFWRLVHQDILNLGSWSDYVYWSPHFHVIGYFPKIKEKSNDFQVRTGWIYKNLKATDSICRTVSYLLTHHAYRPGATGYTYFGHYSYNRAKAVSHESIIELINCERCGSVMHEWVNFAIDSTGLVDFTRAEDLGESHVSRKRTRFKLTKWIIKELQKW